MCKLGQSLRQSPSVSLTPSLEAILLWDYTCILQPSFPQYWIDYFNMQLDVKRHLKGKVPCPRTSSLVHQGGSHYAPCLSLAWLFSFSFHLTLTEQGESKSWSLLLSGFVRVLENLESPGILWRHFLGLESPWKRPLVLESSGNLLNSAKK